MAPHDGAHVYRVGEGEMKPSTIVITPKTMREHRVTATVRYRIKYHWRVIVAMMLLKMAAMIGGITLVEEDER